MRNVHIYNSVNRGIDQLTLEKVGVVFFVLEYYVGVAHRVLPGRYLVLAELERSKALEGGSGPSHLVAVEVEEPSSGAASMGAGLTGNRRSDGTPGRSA